MMKRNLLSAAFALMALAVSADEGMWMLTDLKSQNEAAMMDLNLQIPIRGSSNIRMEVALKYAPDQYPEEALSTLGYKHYLYSAQKKGYSGVAILTKKEPDHVEYGMGIEEYDNEGRFIRADFGDISVVSVYHPSGTSGDERQAFKMVWLEKFQEYVTELRKSRPKLILCGDYNICHEPIDIHDPIRNATNSGFLPEEREWMTRFLNAGFIDTFRLLHPEQQEYTWWSYRFNSRAKNKGWRIDYCMVTEPVRPLLKEARILNDAVHSDHCPMLLDIEG